MNKINNHNNPTLPLQEDTTLGKATSNQKPPKSFPLWAKITIPVALFVIATSIFIGAMFCNKPQVEDSRYAGMTARQVLEDINKAIAEAAKPVADIAEHQRNDFKNRPSLGYRLEEDNFNTLPDTSYSVALGVANAENQDIEKARQAAHDYFVGNGWVDKIFPSTNEIEKMQNRRYYVLNNLFVCTYSSPDSSGIMLECAALVDFDTSQNEAKDYYDAYKTYAAVHEGSIKENPLVLTVKNGAQALPGYGNKQDAEAPVDGFDYAALNLADLSDPADVDVSYYYQPVNNDWRAYTMQKLPIASLDYPICSGLQIPDDPAARQALANTLCYIGGDSLEVISYNDYWQNDMCSDLVTCFALGKRRPFEHCSERGNSYFATFDEDGNLLSCISLQDLINTYGEDWSNASAGEYKNIGNIFAADKLPGAPEDTRCPAGYFATGLQRAGDNKTTFYNCLNRKTEKELQGSCPNGYASVYMNDGSGSRRCWNTNYVPSKGVCTTYEISTIEHDDAGNEVAAKQCVDGHYEFISDPNGPEWL